MIAESVAVAAFALALDFAFGDPRNRYHPTAWIGGVLAKLAPPLRNSNAAAERLGGVLLVSVPTAAAVALLYTLDLGISLITTDWAALAASVAAGAILLKTTVAIRGMERHAAAVLRRLDQGGLDPARASLSAIVKRRTGHLDKSHVISGVLESISENTVDGITGPLFYYAVFGLPGAFVYRVVNTADSMVGYRTDIFRNVGWFAARCDTVLNCIPSRLTGLVMVASAALLKQDWRASYAVMVRDRKKTASANAGYPMAALAGALGTRLEKTGHYRLGDGNGIPPEERHVRSAISMMRLTSVLFFGLVTVPIITVLSTIGWWWPHA